MKLSPKRKPALLLPTRAEFRILQVLWEVGQGTVEDVVRRLPSNPPPNYKTVQTLLRILEQKKFVRHTTRGRVFIFVPCVTREEVGRLSVRNLLQQNFGGSPTELMVNLLEGGPIEESELDELEALIRRHRIQKSLGSQD
ncbi:MAG: BlaI/MecI/CopY family transcriptional regulator [Terriglobia bacterium]